MLHAIVGREGCRDDPLAMDPVRYFRRWRSLSVTDAVRLRGRTGGGTDDNNELEAKQHCRSEQQAKQHRRTESRAKQHPEQNCALTENNDCLGNTDDSNTFGASARHSYARGRGPDQQYFTGTCHNKCTFGATDNNPLTNTFKSRSRENSHGVKDHRGPGQQRVISALNNTLAARPTFDNNVNAEHLLRGHQRSGRLRANDWLRR